MSLMLQKLSESSVFDDVVQDVADRCPPIDLPWLNVELSSANIRQNSAQPDDSCERSVDHDSHSTASKLPAAAAADYSHLYIYKNHSSTTASSSQRTADYIALSSSSSSDEDEIVSRYVEVVGTDDIDMMIVDDIDNDVTTVSSATAAAPATDVHDTSHSQLYISPNTGIQLANPNKKRKRKQSRL